MNLKGHSDIISKLGGGKKLTIRLKNLTEENINEKTVYSWVQQGIPDKWKVAVARCLLEDNIEIDKYKEFLPPGISIDNLTAANNSIKIRILIYFYNIFNTKSLISQISLHFA